VRGKTKATSVEETRATHNATAGSAEGVAAAKSLGDLSHNVFAGSDHEGEVLFVDLWNSLTGLGQFFSNPQVEAGAGLLFESRDAVVWAPTSGFGDFHLAIPAGRFVTGLGLLRTKVNSLEKAAAGFGAYANATINQARSHGIVSHTTWTRVPNPGEEPVAEVIGVDLWLDADRMGTYYALSIGFEHLGPVFSGQPDTSTWRSAPGEWIEW
jgi:hypothetical protein